MRLISQGGIHAATTRAIAKQSGITEGAIYRHYKSKDELQARAYERIVSEMIQEKQQLKDSDRPIRETLREWVRLTYDYFDHHQDAFRYVLLIPPPSALSDPDVTTQQGQLFMELFKKASAAGVVRRITPEIALSHFTGTMLNIPRLICEGILAKPAVQYTDEVADTIWRIFQVETR